MKNLLKPMLLTTLLTLPMIGIASAGPVDDLQGRRADIRQALRDHRDDLNTARHIQDEDGIINARARIHEDEALLRQNTADLARLNAVPSDETQTYMVKRRVITTTRSPYEAEFAPQYTVHYDSISGKPFYVRVYP